MSEHKDLSYATQSRWVCQIPIKDIFSDLTEDFTLNLTKFTIPELELKSASMAFMGYTVEVPTGIIQPDTKRLTLSYMLSSDFKQYLTLYRWLEQLSTIQSIIEPTNTNVDKGLLMDYRLPLNITLLSTFKKPIFNVRYNNCWITGFGQLDLDYQSEDLPITHSFTLTYTDFKMTPINP
jgi:hypothetical protein